MFVIFLVALFCVALVLTWIGLYLSPRPRAHAQRDIDYVSPTGARGSQRNRARNVRRNVTLDQPLRRSSALVESGVGTYRRYASARGESVENGVGLWVGRFPYWLKLTLISAVLFGLFLALFVQMMNFRILPAVAFFDNMSSQGTPVATTALTAENLGASGASQAVVRIAQLDQGQYSSQNEYDTWAYSACSVASMTEIINAYGNKYRLTDILKVEASVHAISPELGLLEDKGIDRTMAHFGFKMVPLQHPTLDGAIAVANQGHPLIISFRNSDYWPGGHILVLRGGDAQNVSLADSSRLNLTIVPRDRFLQWWHGFIALAVPQ